MKRIVYVIEMDVLDDWNEEDLYIPDLFDNTPSNLAHLAAYEPLPDNAPIRLNISYDGVEEV